VAAVRSRRSARSFHRSDAQREVGPARVREQATSPCVTTGTETATAPGWNSLSDTANPVLRAWASSEGSSSLPGVFAEYLAFAADFLSIVVTEIGSITERRLFRLDDGTLNRGLPDMLVPSEQVGMDCGYMLPQYLCAALVSDCKTLAHPDAVDSIPTCANQEDHVSMANNAGRHARQVVTNIEVVVAVELLMATQALDLRVKQGEVDEYGLSTAARAVRALVRSDRAADGRTLSYLKQDVVLYPWVRRATELVHDGAVVAAVTAEERA